jgi:hypothetical protein
MSLSRNEFLFTGLLNSLLPLLVVSLFFVLPCTFWAFRIEDAGFRWVLCIGYALMLVIIASVFIAAISGGFPGEVFGWAIFVSLASSAVTMFGLQLLYANGYRLTNFARAAAQQAALKSEERQSPNSAPSPFDIEPTTASLKPLDNPLTVKSRKRHRIAVGILLIGTAIVNSGIWAFSQIHQKRSLARIVADGGSVEMANGKPIRIAFGPSASEAELEKLPSIPSVKGISLAGTRVREVWLRKNFSALESLDIRNTHLKPNDINYMYHHTSIEILVSEGQFSASEIRELASRRFTVRQIAD